MPRTSTIIASLGGLALSGCIGLIVDAAKHHTINMENWELRTLALGLRGDSSGICPGTAVQIAMSGEAEHKKRKNKSKRLETWSGDPQSANRNGKMSFAEFDVSVAGGTLDENGFFTASGDMFATAISGFDIQAKYKRDGGTLSDKKHYPPSYHCITSAGLYGAGGEAGYVGAAGNPGEDGGAAGSGADGSAGGPASDGGPGGPGARIVAYATMVRTPHHPQLALLRVTGDIEQTMLFDPTRPIVLVASGGAGGPGGQGGTGGQGGAGGAGSPGGAGGSGGPGGNGANGGPGGNGGSLALIYDAKFPQLADAFTLDANGGPGGEAGWAGPGGNGGAGGAAEGEGAEAGADGAVGSEGVPGQPGAAGQPGVARAQAGDVASIFTGLPPEIVRL